MLASEREVSLARVLLYCLDQLAQHDSNQEYIFHYNLLKPFAEDILRAERAEGRVTDAT